MQKFARLLFVVEVRPIACVQSYISAMQLAVDFAQANPENSHGRAKIGKCWPRANDLISKQHADRQSNYHRMDAVKHMNSKWVINSLLYDTDIIAGHLLILHFFPVAH